MGRRAFVSGLGVTAAAGIGTKYLGSPVGDAEAAAPLLLAAGAAGVVAGAVGGIAFGSTFGGPSDEDVADSLGWNTLTTLYTNQYERNLNLEQTVASLRRDIDLVENKAREEAIFAIYEQAVDNGSETTAEDAATEVIDETYDVVKKAILDTWSARVERTAAIATALDQSDGVGDGYLSFENTGTESDYVDEAGDYSRSSPRDEWDFTSASTRTTTLYNGDDYSFSRLYGSSDTCTTCNNYYHHSDPFESFPEDGTSSSSYSDSIYLDKPNHNDFDTVDEPIGVDYEDVALVEPYRWYDMMEDLDQAHSDMISEVSSMVATYFEPAEQGEIDLFQMVGPKHLTDTAANAQDYQEAAMALRAMGYPLSQQVVTLELPTTDGGSLELTGRLSWTAHQGNALPVGEPLNAGDWPGSIFAAVNIPDGVDSLDGNETETDTDGDLGAEVVELTDEFTILSAEGAGGVSFEERQLADADQDYETLTQIYADNTAANEEATENVHETATGGGGGLPEWGELTTGQKVIAVVATGGLAYGALN